LYAVPPNDEDRYVEKICEKSVELFGGLIKKIACRDKQLKYVNSILKKTILPFRFSFTDS